MGELRGLVRLAIALCRVCLWVVVTVWLGAKAIWQARRLLRQWQHVRQDRLTCPRGHEVVLLGTWTCACGAAFDGFAFAKCAVCGRTAGWVPCPRCQLVIRNPTLE